MAVVVGTVQGVHGFTVIRGDQPALTDTSEYQIVGCFVDVTWPSGTYAQADDANFAAATAIAAARRNGKTPSVLQAAFADCGKENGSLVGADACTNSAGTVTCALLQEDLSTERANGAMSSTWQRPVTFFVSFKELTD
jgi:hypothetical protein